MREKKERSAHDPAAFCVRLRLGTALAWTDYRREHRVPVAVHLKELWPSG
jgi:hypothetical protein